MKSTGIVRKLGKLGRFVLPIELRNERKMENGTSIEFLIEGESLVLRRYDPVCIFCGNLENTFLFKNQIVCLECAKEIAER